MGFDLCIPLGFIIAMLWAHGILTPIALFFPSMEPVIGFLGVPVTLTFLYWVGKRISRDEGVKNYHWKLVIGYLVCGVIILLYTLADHSCSASSKRLLMEVLSLK